MIYLKDFSRITEVDIEKFIKWKSDPRLSDLIMSEVVTLNHDEVNQWMFKNSNDDNQYFKFICKATNNEVIGLARLMYIDLNARKAEVGLYIGDEIERNKNIGKLVLNELIIVAKEKYDLNKLYAKINMSNIGSIKLFYKMGFIKEGILRKHYFSALNELYNDVIVVSKFF